MARKKKHARKQTDLAAAGSQPGREPQAFENIIIDMTPGRRRSFSEDDFHYPGTRRSRYRDQDRPDVPRKAVPNEQRSRAPASRQLPDQYRPAESRKSVAFTSHAGPLPSHEHPDQYRPGNTTRARWDTWGPSPSEFGEPHSTPADYGPGSGLGDLQQALLSFRDIPQTNEHGINLISLPTPNRTGTIDIRAPLLAGGRENASLRMQPSSTGKTATSPTWRPDATTPSYMPLLAAPLAVQTSSRIRPTNSLTPYQPLRSIHTAKTRSAWAEQERARILSQEGWTGSVTQRTAHDRLLFDQVENSGTAQQRRSKTREPEISDFRKDRALLKPLPIPEPTAQYLQQANQSPRQSPNLRPLLLVIDLNGTLVDRRRRSNTFVARPNLAPFVEYVLANHTLMIWSSAQPENVRSVCQRLFSPTQRAQVIAEWGRDTLDLTAAQYREKVQVYKRLEKIWENDVIRDRHPDAGRGGVWDQSNTVLIDDSRLKGAAQPHNLLEIPEFHNTPEQPDTDVLAQVVGYLEELRLQEDVSKFMRQRSFKVDDGWARPWREEVQIQNSASLTV